MQLRSLSAAMALLGSINFHSIAANAAETKPVIVTATRTAEMVDDSLASVTVITREEIERLQAQSLQDLLRGVAGLGVVNNGGAGKSTSVFMRGAESDHLLVLIDGVKVGSATMGSTPFQDVPVAQVERIEIVRGPRSSLYGSEAIGGVIQIFTRKRQGSISPSFSVSAGSYGTYATQAGVAGGGEEGWFSATLSNLNTTGFNACNGTASAGCRTVEPDRDGHHNAAASVRGGFRFARSAEAEFSALRSESDTRYDGSYVNESSSAQQVVGGRIRVAPAPDWQTTFAAGESRDESDNFKDGVFKSRYNTRRHSATWQNDVTVGPDRLLTFGLDQQNDHVDSATAYAVDSRGNTALFTQYQGDVGAHDIEISLRRDDNEQFGYHTTGGLALGTDLGHELRGMVSYGTAFKAPTFNELYFPGYGNAALRPERSYNIEAGIAGKTPNGRWSLNAFETRIDNLIAFDASIFAPNNLDEARIRGVEAICSVEMRGWEVDANLTLLDPENRAGNSYGKILPRRAKTAYRLDADRALGAYQVGASLRAEGRRYDDLNNTSKLGGYATVDLRAGYDLAKAWRLQTRVENLFDKEYETAALFNQTGRSVYVTLRYQP